MQHDKQAEPEVIVATEVALLPVAERAAIAVGTAGTESALIKMAEDAKEVTAIDGKDAYTEAQAKRMTLRNARLAVAKRGKEAREDAQAFSKAVIEEEQRLIAIVSGEESRIKKLQDDYDAEQEAIKQRAIDEENRKKELIRNTIDTLRNMAVRAVSMKPDEIRALQNECEATTIDADLFGDHYAYAEHTKSEARANLANILQLAISREEQAARQREQEERERKQREDEERRAKEEAEALRKQNEELQRQLAELQAKSAPAPSPAADEEKPRTVEEYGRSIRLTAEDIGLKEPLETAAKPESIAGQPIEEAVDQSEPERPADTEIIEAVAETFDVTVETARKWIAEVQFFL